MGESISAGCQGNARGLAMLAAAMANKGTWNGIKLMSEETWNKMHSEPNEEIDAIWGTTTFYTKGGLNKF
jgi:hypothetical protein